MTHFPPGVRAFAMGLQQDSDQYVAYLRHQEDILDKASNSATEIHRPKLAKSTIESIQIFDTLYTAYLLDGGKADYLSLIYAILNFAATRQNKFFFFFLNYYFSYYLFF